VGNKRREDQKVIRLVSWSNSKRLITYKIQENHFIRFRYAHSIEVSYRQSYGYFNLHAKANATSPSKQNGKT